MKYDFIFYETDDSFDFGDFPGGTCYQLGYHGFSINISVDSKVDITSLEPFGDYAAEMQEIKSLKELKNYLIKHIDEVLENRKIFEELIQII